MARGGYQPPADPAPVGLPGALSRRTDGGPADRQPMRQLPDAAYGEQQTFRQDQQAAPMERAPGAAQAPPPSPVVQPADLSNVVPLNADTQNPVEPVTAGAALGEGPGVAALGLGQDDDPAVRNLRDVLPALELMANSPSAGFAFKQFVRRARSVM